MKKYLITLILAIAPLCSNGEPDKNWMNWATTPQKYDTVTIKQIQAYCNSHRDEVAYWHDQFVKRTKLVAPKGTPKVDPVAGMVQGAEELARVHMTFYMNLRASQGWRVVSVSRGFVIFERLDTKP